MSPNVLSSAALRTLNLVTLLIVAGCAAPAVPSTAPATNSTLAALEYSGSQQALESLDRSIAAAGVDSPKVNAVIHDLVAALQAPDATFAARQAAAQRLGALLQNPAADDSALATLAPWLLDEHLANLARLALEPVPGVVVDAIFLRALRETGGATRLALIQSAGNRRLASALPLLVPSLRAPDPRTAVAAARALGQIGSTEALAALAAAPNPIMPAVVEARLACAWSLPEAEGVAEFQHLLDNHNVAAHQRANALRGLLGREPATAADRVIQTLGGDEVAFKRVAIEAISSLATTVIVPALSAHLASWDAPTQAAVIAALAEKGDVAAAPAISAAAANADADVRAAAITALGRLPGNRDIALQLARLAADGSDEEGRLARASLARLDGPGVAAGVIAGAEHEASRVRAVFLEIIGSRGMSESVPLLLKTRGEADASLRAAALRALADVAPASTQPEVLSWTIAATDVQEISRAQRALVSVLLRDHDVAGRGRLVVDAIDHGAPAAQLRLLPVLPRLNTAAALACAGRLALQSNADVASPAISTLARWPDAASLPLLVTTAEQSTLREGRLNASKGAIDFLERGRSVPKNERTDLVARLLAADTSVDVRRQLVLLLGRGVSDSALTLAERLQAEPALADDARSAAASIHANRMWPPVLTASAASGQLGNLVDGNPKSVWSVPAIADQWIQIDCKQSRPLLRITLDETGHAGDYPEHYEVYVTDDAAKPGSVRASGGGHRDKTVIDLPAGTSGQFILIKSTRARANGNWVIAELRID